MVKMIEVPQDYLVECYRIARELRSKVDQDDELSPLIQHLFISFTTMIPAKLTKTQGVE